MPTPYDAIRVNDADRAKALDSLTNLTQTGYINFQEFEQRSKEVTEARTRGDLNLLFNDIPASAFQNPETNLPARHYDSVLMPPDVPSLQLPQPAEIAPAGRQIQRATGFQIRLGIFSVVSLLTVPMIVAASTDNNGDGNAPVILIQLMIPLIVAILLFVMKVGPKRWYEEKRK